MKKFIVVGFVVMLVGCSYDMQTYVDKPQTLLEDPLSVGNKKALDALEQSYIKKEISYDEYLKQKSQLEDDYSRQVQERDHLIQNDR
jgi:hypothetical protein